MHVCGYAANVQRLYAVYVSMVWCSRYEEGYEPRRWKVPLSGGEKKIDSSDEAMAAYGGSTV